MKYFNRVLLVCFFASLGVLGASAATWFVETDGDDDAGDGSAAAPFATIQRAVTAAASLDSIALGDGQHTGGVTISDKYLAFYSRSGDCATCRIVGSGTGIYSYNSGPASGFNLVVDNISFSGLGNGVQADFNAFFHMEIIKVKLSGCRFDHCTSGLVTLNAVAMLDGCRFENNSSYGVNNSGGAVVEDCVFRGNGTGLQETGFDNFWGSSCGNSVFVGNTCGYRGGMFYGSRFNQCRLDSNAVGLEISSGGAAIIDCLVRDNSQNGIQLTRTVHLSIRSNTEISGNGGHGVASIESGAAEPFVMSDSRIAGNGGHGVDLRGVGYSYSLIENSLLTDNGGDGFHWVTDNAGLRVFVRGSTVAGNSESGLDIQGGWVSLTSSIVALNGGQGLLAGDATGLILACTDIQGNEGGDWVGPLAGLESLDGNLWTAPLFCDPSNGDYTVSGFSPCLPGAHPDGFDCGLIGAQPVGSCPAQGLSVYEALVPTLADSSELWNETFQQWTTFRVTGLTGDPLAFVHSLPDSGYSVNNLPPAAPSDLVVVRDVVEGYRLSWRQPPTPDLREFQVLRGEGGDSGPFYLRATTLQTTYHDPDPTAGMVYRVLAVDSGGNQSPVCGTLTLIAATRAALVGLYPNPANPLVTIVFELPTRMAVSLEIYDLKGRLMAQLINGKEREAGRQVVTWSGVDSQGRRVPSGAYISRFQAGGTQETRRLTLVR